MTEGYLAVPERRDSGGSTRVVHRSGGYINEGGYQ